MMGGVSPETCWAIKKHWNNKSYYTVASCWLFLWDLYYDVRIHDHNLLSLRMNVTINNRECLLITESLVFKHAAWTGIKLQNRHCNSFP
jgi:hypothetical protein